MFFLEQTELAQAVPLSQSSDGVIRVKGTRITLDTIVTAFEEGCTAEEIAQQYPSLTLADIYASIGYYLRHRAEVETYLKERRALSDSAHRENERRFDPRGVRERLLGRRRGKEPPMLRLAVDENFNNDILRGILRRAPELEIVRVQDAGLAGAEDPAVLDWAAREGRVLFTHDVSTMTHCAYQRAQAGLRMPGPFEVSRSIPIARAIEDILLIAECSAEDEWQGQVRYLPL